jgi:hypothetical protein
LAIFNETKLNFSSLDIQKKQKENIKQALRKNNYKIENIIKNIKKP